MSSFLSKIEPKPNRVSGCEPCAYRCRKQRIWNERTDTSYIPDCTNAYNATWNLRFTSPYFIDGDNEDQIEFPCTSDIIAMVEQIAIFAKASLAFVTSRYPNGTRYRRNEQCQMLIDERV